MAFIVLCFATTMTDSITSWLEAIMMKISWLPNSFDWYVAYIVVSCIAFVFCNVSHFGFFSQLGLVFNAHWEDYLASSFLLAAGSKFTIKCFGTINSIPQLFTGVCSYFTSGSSVTTSVTSPVTTVPGSTTTTPTNATSNTANPNLAP